MYIMNIITQQLPDNICNTYAKRMQYINMQKPT